MYRYLKLLHKELVLPAERHEELDGVVPVDLQGGIRAQIPQRNVLPHLGVDPEDGNVDGEGGAEGEEGGDHVAGLGQVGNSEAVPGHQFHFGGQGGRVRPRAEDGTHRKPQVCLRYGLIIK